MFARDAWTRQPIKSSPKLKDKPSPVDLLHQVKSELGLVKGEKYRSAYNVYTKKLFKSTVAGFTVTLNKSTLTKGAREYFFLFRT